MTIKLGYARVSTTTQSTRNQIATLKAAGCSEIFKDDAISGKANDQAKGHQALMARAKELRAQGEEVTVCVTKLDRFSRSLVSLISNVEALATEGASFTALEDNFSYEANSPTSTLFLQILGAVAQFERSLIESRMADGLSAKVAKGMIRGRKPTLRKATVEAIRNEYAAGGVTDRELASKWGASRSTIQRVLGIHGYTKPYVDLETFESANEAARK